MNTTPSETQTQALSRAESIKALKIKIMALEFAALQPEIECNGIHGHHIHATSQIEKCCDEALALVDELTMNYKTDENGFLVTVARHAGEGPEAKP